MKSFDDLTKSIQARVKSQNIEIERIKRELEKIIKHYFPKEEFKNIIVSLSLRKDTLIVRAKRKIIAQELGYYQKEIIRAIKGITKIIFQ
ncbi:MAG: hypothetical protein COV31_01590 [Candidatus Yanofskybacteria bacterium CG10_big_fil_rev_8_21_14_0_10_46_23]|uniref:Uncharacterized protein n=1 Tax=Candidatus Yanofskybacteria bacterium CG10_big_fil_rev_8_21_14_0_10_46_23 TaxID=1975098 RepID=A0A2H0R4C1_9BACT|nr:MAG: hypothetical protein COV31_01590 [Candidatus Yanofskybacteria bacterium CG10_big_fil_rev_8_21_14_0_10_46_23]